MPDDLRCSCGFAEKIGAALERIVSSTTYSGHRIFWDFHQGKLGYPWMNIKENKQGEMVVDAANSCDLSAAIMELSLKVKPPKPREREWRVGDVVMLKDEQSHMTNLERGKPYLISSVDEERGVCVRVGDDHEYSIGKSHYRNRTIEAEQAGEGKS